MIGQTGTRRSRTMARAMQAPEATFAELVEHYKGERGAFVPLLQGAQAIFGYLPQE